MMEFKPTITTINDMEFVQSAEYWKVVGLYLEAKKESDGLRALVKRYASEHAVCAEEEPGEGCPCSTCDEARKVLGI